MTITKALFSPHGRMRRRDFWIYVIATSVVSMALNIGLHSLVSKETWLNDARTLWMDPLTPPHLLSFAIIIIFLWPHFCINTKRLHDRNLSGWLWVGYMALNYAYMFSGLSMAPTFNDGHFGPLFWPHMGMAVVMLCAALALLVVTGFLDGTKGSNKYGPSPKGISDEAAVF